MKTYNGEKAIISLTSWKARINTVSKTLFSLVRRCPGFHIVLVLSEEEFPKKEKELPKSLMAFVNNNLIEILWVYKNYKSFKKVLFTMDKYRDVPVISADDGCIYTTNFAEPLYQVWLKNKKCVVTTVFWNNDAAPGCGGGSGVLYPPFCFGLLGKVCVEEHWKILNTNPNDDRFMAWLIKFARIHIIPLDPHNGIRVFVNTDSSGLSVSRAYIRGSNWKFRELIMDTIKKFKQG